MATINEEECLEIVRHALKGEGTDVINVLSYEVRSGSNDLIGFMGEYFKLNVRLEDKMERSGVRSLTFFLKSVPVSNAFHRDECQRKGFFGKETRIYAEILPNIQRYVSAKLTPECFYTRPDLIVLEDLTASPAGYRQLDAGQKYTAQHHRIVLRHLARLHAGSIAWEQAEGVNVGERFEDVLVEMQLTTKNEWYLTGAKGILFLAKRHDKFQDAASKKFINEDLFRILCNAEELTNPSKRWRNVLCHRDCWDRNIFFTHDARGEPNDCCVVDFQLTRYSPPAIDILFFIYVTTTVEERKRIYDGMLDCYHGELQACFREMHLPVDTVTREEFLSDCRRARLAAIINWAICEPLMKMPEGLANKLRREEAEKFDFYMNKERDEMFLRIMAMDPTYKATIMTPIEELIDYVRANVNLY